ncbi:hypothetical protein K8O68_08045 [Salipaludibacillus sp. CUR1]|uniref:hypothetical protein n=1 Tax=Salipaludibacillus sp. CUR1 TaxID=2820003 RepID=UPI001E2EE889|nr:hypothetical protein [Salipaludibacillus sp. CUR1]MCE7792369.1 hypothetical protein [Salipaludibacillus sp. CUR1]
MPALIMRYFKFAFCIIVLPISGFFTIWSAMLEDFSFIFFFLFISTLYLLFGTDLLKNKKVKKVIMEKINENSLYVDWAYHESEGKGRIALTDKNAIFINKKVMYVFPYEEIATFGTGGRATGHSLKIPNKEGNMYMNSAFIEEVPTFYIIGSRNGEDYTHEWLVPAAPRLFKKMNKIEPFNLVGEMDNHKISL